jgi:hypothetical protein
MQEVTKDEATSAAIDLPVEYITDPGSIMEKGGLPQIIAWISGDRKYIVTDVEGLTEEQRTGIISGDIKVSVEGGSGDSITLILSDGSRLNAKTESYSYNEIMMNPSLIQGLGGLSLNGIVNTDADAVRNGLMQTGQSNFIVAYDPTYGFLPDLLEVGYNKFLGQYLPTINISQDNEFVSMFNQQNPTAIVSGHSAGGTRLYLATQNDVGSFEYSYLQLFGAPVNKGSITDLVKGNINNDTVVGINRGDTVGNILGRNSNGILDFGYNVITSPLLITPWSPHSNYLCQAKSCQNEN